MYTGQSLSDATTLRLGHCWASLRARVRSNSRTCTNWRQQHIGNTLATHWQHISNTLATH